MIPPLPIYSLHKDLYTLICDWKFDSTPKTKIKVFLSQMSLVSVALPYFLTSEQFICFSQVTVIAFEYKDQFLSGLVKYIQYLKLFHINCVLFTRKQTCILVQGLCSRTYRGISMITLATCFIVMLILLKWACCSVR